MFVLMVDDLTADLLMVYDLLTVSQLKLIDEKHGQVPCFKLSSVRER